MMHNNPSAVLPWTGATIEQKPWRLGFLVELDQNLERKKYRKGKRTRQKFVCSFTGLGTSSRIGQPMMFSCGIGSMTLTHRAGLIAPKQRITLKRPSR